MKTVGRLEDDRGQKVEGEQLWSEPGEHRNLVENRHHFNEDDDDQVDDEQDDGDTWGRQGESHRRSQH